MNKNNQIIKSFQRDLSKLALQTKPAPLHAEYFQHDVKEAQRQHQEKQSIKELRGNDAFMRKYLNETIGNFLSTTSLAGLKPFTKTFSTKTPQRRGLAQSTQFTKGESRNELAVNLLKDKQLTV